MVSRKIDRLTAIEVLCKDRLDRVAPIKAVSRKRALDTHRKVCGTVLLLPFGAARRVFGPAIRGQS